MKLLNGLSVRTGHEPIPIGSWGGVSRKKRGYSLAMSGLRHLVII